jgi:hypothetical protein
VSRERLRSGRLDACKTTEEEQQVAQLLTWIGRLSGCLGVLVCAAAVVARASGTWLVGGIQIGALFQLGMAAMILACLAYCAQLAERPRK